MTSQSIREHFKELQALPPLSPVVNKVDLTERMVLLQNLQSLGPDEIFNSVKDVKLTEEDRKALASLDWKRVIDLANRWYDRTVAAMRLEDRADRVREFDRLDRDFAAAVSDTHGPRIMVELLRRKDAQPKVIADALGILLINLLKLDHRKCADRYNCVIQNARNLDVAFALAAYRRDRERYPARTADLAPKYLAAVPNDLFSGKDLIYKPNEKGYTLYSVGPNGKDDGGRGKDDTPAGDDLGVTMPLTPRQK